MTTMMVDKKVLSVILFLTNLIQLYNCQLEVTRVKNSFIDNHFYSTSDYFTNPERTKNFCSTRNAICQKNCRQCKCYNSRNTFISYQHGCLKMADSRLVLNSTRCLFVSPARNDETIAYPLHTKIIKPNGEYFYPIKSRIHKLFFPRSINNIKSCTVTRTSYYDMKHGGESQFTTALQASFTLPKISGSSVYFKCRQGHCNIRELEGKLMRLSIECSTTTGGETVKTCFVFKLNGTNTADIYVPKDIPTPKPVTTVVKPGTLFVERSQRIPIGDFYLSDDTFTNPKQLKVACVEYNAYCDLKNKKCSVCACKSGNTFLSYSSGCVKSRTLRKILGFQNCTNIEHSTDIDMAVISPTRFKYGTCVYIQMPSATIDSENWSCNVESMSYIASLSGNVYNVNEMPFQLKFSRLKSGHICLQCTSFICDLMKYSGNILKIDIKCRNNTKTSHAIDTCFTFKMAGKLQVNEITSAATENKGSVKIERRILSEEREHKIGNHYLSRDFFSNPGLGENFCWSRKSLCDVDSPSCSKCKCSSDYSTFVSYDQGCMNITTDSTLYGIDKCMNYLGKVVLVKASFFKEKQCIYLLKPANLQHKDWSCSISQLLYADPLNDKQTVVQNIPFEMRTSRIRKTNFCFQCKSFNCQLSALRGMLVKLSVKCRNYEKQQTTCFAFKIDGVFSENGTIPIASNILEDERMSSGSVAAIVIVVCLLVILGTALFVFWRRRKLRREKSDCAHQVFENRRSTIIEKNDIKLAEVYACTGACPSKQPVQQKIVSNQNEESLYYRPSDKSRERNIIYAATEINTNKIPPQDRKDSAKNDQEKPPPYLTDNQNIYTSATEALDNPLYGSDENEPRIDASHVKNDENIYMTAADQSNNPIYGDGSEEDLADYTTMSSNVGVSSYTKPVEENYYMTAVDNKDNPIYGTDDKTPDYSTVDNNLSQENKYYAGSMKQQQNQYASVKKKKKPVLASRNHAYDNVDERQQQQQNIDDSEDYYQVGDIVRSGYPKQ